MDHLLAILAKAIERRRLTRALRESEARHRLVTENITDGVFLVDTAGRVGFAKRRGGELAGRGALSLLPPESLARAEARLAATRAGEAVPPFFEAELVRKDGTRV